MSTLELPIVDLDIYLTDPASPAAREEATKAVDSLINYGALLLHDSRASSAANARFLDLLEDYFAQNNEKLQEDVRPQFHYQVGTTLSNTETPKCHSHADCQAVIAALDPAERPISTSSSDTKCRFFHRMGKDPPSTAFPTLAMPNVTPAAFRETWNDEMEDWGKQIKGAVEGVVELIAVGLGLERRTLLDAGMYGPHLLAPTATTLEGRVVDEVFAGFHTDLNAVTIHGRSRYPGLHIWARNSGKKLAVTFPSKGNYLLVQASKQLEHLTNGLILAGYHEVICTPSTIAVLHSRKQGSLTANRPQIRISSTFFWHFSADYRLCPRGFIEKLREVGFDEGRLVRLEKERGGKIYEEGMLVGDLVQEELRSIALDTSDG